MKCCFFSPDGWKFGVSVQRRSLAIRCSCQGRVPQGCGAIRDTTVTNFRLWRKANVAVGQKKYPKWNPGKWTHRLKPAVPRWWIFDPYPCSDNRVASRATGTSGSRTHRSMGTFHGTRDNFPDPTSKQRKGQKAGRDSPQLSAEKQTPLTFRWPTSLGSMLTLFLHGVCLF